MKTKSRVSYYLNHGSTFKKKRGSKVVSYFSPNPVLRPLVAKAQRDLENAIDEELERYYTNVASQVMSKRSPIFF